MLSANISRPGSAPYRGTVARGRQETMPKRNIIWIVAILLAAMVVVLATRNAPRPGLSPETRELRTILDTRERIRRHYYGPLDEQALRRGIVRGMVTELDKYSTYIPPDAVEAFRKRTESGVERGIGLRLEETDGEIRVVVPLAGSPAHRAGIRPGDLIIAVGDEPVDGLAPAEVEKLLKVPLNEQVRLTIVRDDERAGEITLTCREFPIETVVGLCRDESGHWMHVIDPDARVAYVRIREFVRGTDETLQAALRAPGEIRGLVLDLRANPGGLPTQALNVANMFLSDGVIATFVSRSGRGESFPARAHGTHEGTAIVVLIDARTASAAEIVAGALWLNSRAVLVGQRTRGKGYLQSMIELGDGLGQMNLTTGEVLLGEDWAFARHPGSDDWGICPDVEEAIPLRSRRQLRRLRVHAEAPAPGEPETTPATALAEPLQAIAQELLQLDTQLATAVELLKSPARMDSLVRAAREARAKKRAAATQPAEHDE